MPKGYGEKGVASYDGHDDLGDAGDVVVDEAPAVDFAKPGVALVDFWHEP